jgi:hypothetical protein
MNRAGQPLDFSRWRNRSALISFVTLICLGCLVQSDRPQGLARDLEVDQWAAIDSGRVADWAAQLPVGEAKREGIVGFVIV